ncbi:MAG: 3-oxoadipate enol-lactonase [Candidatus Velthaea sp.]
MSFIRAGDLNVFYELSGPANAPVVIFANSLGTNVHVWDEQIAAFANEFRVLRYDMRGHGLTDGAGTKASIDILARDVAALLGALGIPRVSFVGLSIGGMVGQRFAAAYPERTQSLVLCATGNRIGTPEVWNARIASVEAAGMTSVIASVLDRWFTPDTRSLRPELVRGFGTMLERMPVPGYAAACAGVRDSDLREDDTRITAPTLILAGAADAVSPPAAGEAMAACIPAARMCVMPNAAHIMSAEAPVEFNAQVLAFLRECVLPAMAAK